MSTAAHIYEIGDRVQATAHGIARQRSMPFKLDVHSTGLIQGYRTPKNGIMRLNVRWLSGKDFPPHYDHVTLATFIEPYGSPR